MGETDLRGSEFTDFAVTRTQSLDVVVIAEISATRWRASDDRGASRAYWVRNLTA